MVTTISFFILWLIFVALAVAVVTMFITWVACSTVLFILDRRDVIETAVV